MYTYMWYTQLSIYNDVNTHTKSYDPSHTHTHTHRALMVSLVLLAQLVHPVTP